MTTTTSAFTELRHIAAQRNGRLLPADVVDNARDESSPLHTHFEWDDGVAAEQFRLVQARDLIRRATVVLSTPNREDPVRVRAFVHVGSKSGALEEDAAFSGHYVAVEDLANDDAARAAFLAQLESEWRAFRRRWRDYDEVLAALVTADFEDVA